MKNSIKLVLFVALGVCSCGYGFEVVDFEPPSYTASQGLPSPWTTTITDVGITNINPISGTQSLYTGYRSGIACKYPLTLPDGDEFKFSVTLRTPSYSPSNYGHGFVSLGTVVLDGTDSLAIRLGVIYFELEKPYGAAINPAHYKILYSNYGVTEQIGTFVNGGTYTVQYQINWLQQSSTVTVTGTGGINVSKSATQGLSGISKTKFTGIGFYGHSVPEQPGMVVVHDDMIIGEQPQPLAGDFDTNGVVDCEDFAVLADCWLSELGDGNWNVSCNLDNDGNSVDKIDVADLLVFTDNWLNSL